MKSHYFITNHDLKNDLKTINYKDDKMSLIFETNNGMFSKDHIDPESIKLVENIEDNSYDTILDLGCGYGFIGAYLKSKYPHSNMYMIDINDIACEYAKNNMKMNNLDATVMQGDGICIEDKFDLITLNPPIHAGKEVVYNLYQQAFDKLNNDGLFYIVIQKKHGAKSTFTKLEEIFDKVECVYSKKGTNVFKSKKY